MKSLKLFPVITAAAVFGLSACSDSTSVTSQLLSDATVTADVAASSGDAMAASLGGMTGNETFSGLAAVRSGIANATSPPLNYSRTATCYDANNAVVSNCTPLSSVRKIVTDVIVTGSRSGSSTTAGGVTQTWTGVAHRTASDTLRRIFNTAQPPVETSRAHGAVGAAHDTTTFTEGDITRVAAEAANDTVKALTWNLPRSSNPWPVSGSIVRVVAVHVTVTRGTQSGSRDVVRTIEVDFPADAQGNVVLKVSGKTCNLNLVTHAVTNCQ